MTCVFMNLVANGNSFRQMAAPQILMWAGPTPFLEERDFTPKTQNEIPHPYVAVKLEESRSASLGLRPGL